MRLIFMQDMVGCPSLVSRTRRSALSAFTRVFDALWRCDADPGPMDVGEKLGPGSAAHHFVRSCCPPPGTRGTYFFANRYAPPFSIDRWNAGRACIRDSQAVRLGYGPSLS